MTIKQPAVGEPQSIEHPDVAAYEEWIASLPPTVEVSRWGKYAFTAGYNTGHAQQQQEIARLREALHSCYIELQYCEQQIRNDRGDYTKRADMWEQPGMVYDALRAARAALQTGERA